MKKCTSCNASVDEAFEYCPLCQNGLEEGTESVGYPAFPKQDGIKRLSLFYKIQLFIAVMVVIICAAVDYWFGVHGDKHWSIVVFICVLVVELMISPLLRKRSVPVYFVSYLALMLAIAFYAIASYMGGKNVCVNITIPIIILFTLTFNFIASLADKNGNALVFSICNIVMGIILPFAMFATSSSVPVLWSSCFIASVIMLIGLIIFKGTVVFREVQKRLNM